MDIFGNFQFINETMDAQPQQQRGIIYRNRSEIDKSNNLSNSIATLNANG